MEEERRLLYVAITRAKRNLMLSFAKARYYNGDITRGYKSRLVAEIDFEDDYGAYNADSAWYF
jgi:DNA helicase-2/ATP-dependent DNA helicase PcrA